MATKTIYKKPPIVERTVGVYRPMKLEDFESKLPSWVEKIKQEYPIAEPISEWFIDITQRKGVPFIRDAQPRAKIIHVFWKRHSKNLKVHGMRLRPDRLVFHLCREEDNPHDFNEVYSEMETWLSRWTEHFEITNLEGITLEYVNVLSHETTPQFSLPNGGINIGKALESFGKIPGEYKYVARPYDCRVRLVVDDKMPCLFDLRVRALDSPMEQVGVAVDFAVNTRAPAKSIDIKQALQEISTAHEVMLKQFDCFFTTEAKKSFLLDGNPITGSAHD